MNGLRLAMLTTYFWPVPDDQGWLVRHLADEFRRQGHAPSIVTAQLHGEWPTRLVHRETPVYRVGALPHSAWETYRYTRALTRWLDQHRSDFDLLYVFGMRLEAYAALQSRAIPRWPVVLRPRGAGPEGDCAWHERHRLGRRIRSQTLRADLWIAPTEVAAQELLQAGYPPHAVQRIDDGVPGLRLGDDSRGQARAALGEIHSDLLVPDYAPLVVYCGPLQPGHHLPDLLLAWQQVAVLWPSAQLWLIGDGPERGPLYELASDLNVRGQVRMPGRFDEWDDILLAADLLLQPHPFPPAPVAMYRALRAGLPVVAVDSPLNRELLRDQPGCRLYPVGDIHTLVAVLRELIERPPGVPPLPEAGCRATPRFAVEESVSRQIRLLEGLLKAQQNSSHPS